MSCYETAYFLDDLQEIIDSCDETEGPQQLCAALELYNRTELLEQCLEIEKYKEEAQYQLEYMKKHKEWQEAQKRKEDAYPNIFKKWNGILKNANKIGIYGVSYPSCNARNNGLGDNYVAISGDGLFQFQFQIISMENDGIFKLSPPKSNEIEGRESKHFKITANCDFNQELTGTEILNNLTKIYQQGL